MISDFIVLHPSNPFFCLTDAEMERAVSKYPDLAKENSVQFYERCCTGRINPGGDCY
jgi:hypothetical protein